MDFEAWVDHVKNVLVVQRPDLTIEDLEADAMYQAFSVGVSPGVYAAAPRLRAKDYSPGGHLPTQVAKTPPVAPPNAGQLGAQFSFSARDRVPAATVSPGQRSRLKDLGALVGAGCLFWVLVCVVSCFAQGQNSAHSAKQAGLSTAMFQPSQPPLTDTRRISAVRQSLARWQGDESTYLSSVASLRTIPSKSASYSEASQLIKRWIKRADDSQRQKIQEAQRAAARQNKEERQTAIDARRKEKADMRYFTGVGDVGVAVSQVELRHSTEDHVAGKNGTFIYLFVAVKNQGSGSFQANPNDFTLADTNGNTASHDIGTYSLNNYFDAVNLTAGQQTAGWLIFYLPKDSEYVLTRSGGILQGDVVKTIIP